MRDPLIGTNINRYEIRESVHRSELIGIYKAYDTKLERFVLLKTILHSSDYSQEAIDFFLAESRSLAKLAHPNIAKVLDFGHENENLYLISEYVPGRTLSELMTQPILWQKAINILLPLTDALLYAHSRGIIHRDLKPDNIIINTDNQPILSDFSLMRIIEEEETRDMTGTNIGLGSPEYISPEQGQGMSVDFRSDIYSLGVIFFEMVTGKKLFYATSSMEIVIQHIMADPPKPRSIIPDLPRSVEVIIMNSISKDREKRFQNMEEFSNAMKAVVEAANATKKKDPNRNKGWLTASLVGAAVVLAALTFIVRSQLRLTPAATVTPMISNLPTIVATATHVIPTLSPIPTKVIVETPTKPDFELPTLPVLPGTPLPHSNAIIDADNIRELTELARWGIPDIRQLAFINGEKTILAATSAGMYYLDPETLTPQYLFDTAGSVSKFTISNDASLVATADDEGTVAVWDIKTGERIHQQSNKFKTITALAFSPDNKKLVFSDTGQNMYYWNLPLDTVTPFEKRHTLTINKIIFLADNQTVVSGGEDFQVMIWDAPSGKWQRQIAADKKILDMALSTDRQSLALALNDASFQVFNFETGEEIASIFNSKIIDPFTFIAFLPNGSNIITGSADGFVRIWSTTNNVPVWESTPTAPRQDPIKTFAIASSGSKFVIGYQSGLVETWDLNTKKKAASSDLQFAPVQKAVISSDDKTLAFQLGDSAVQIMAVTDGTQSMRVAGTLPRGFPVSPNDKLISIRVGNLQADKIKLYSLSTADPQELFQLYDYPVDGSVNYSADNNILTAYADGIFNYWSTSSGLELKESLIKTQGRCRDIYRQDDSFIAAASEIGMMLSDQNLPLFCQITLNPRTLSEAFLPDGSIIAQAIENQLVEIWDQRVGDQKESVTLRPNDDKSKKDVLSVAISKDKKLLAAASSSGTIEIYRLDELKPIKFLDLHTGPINQVLFSNDGKYLIAGLSDGTVRFFGLQP